MKKIAIINSVYKIGSTGRISFELNSFFNMKGFSSKCFYGRYNQKESNSFYFGSFLSRFFHGLKTRLFDKHGLSSSNKTDKLIQQLQDYNPDLYIINNLHGYYINYEKFLLFLKDANKPVICIFHDCWNITGHCAHFDYNGCEKWKTKCSNCAYIKDYPKAFHDNSISNFLLKKKLFNDINNLSIVCPSSWMEGIVRKSFLETKDIYVIKNGIDLNHFMRKDSNFREKYGFLNKKLILSVSFNLDNRKGLNDILKLSSMIDDETRIVLVGKLKTQTKLPKNVIHINRTNNIEELVSLYCSCDCFFNPTYEDTFSNVNMEALACGLPVVCYRSGGAYEMVNEKYVIDKGDVEAAYRMINKIIYGNICYDFGDIASFSKEIMHKKYLNLIEEKMGK